ncbi:MAG: hypothetical protein ABSG78_02300 [Verrucomicrobiota bacterium]|jgi:hypothetical protein
MKAKKRTNEAAVKAALASTVMKALGAKPQPRRTAHGPEPERLKIYGDWKEAVRLAMRKPKPPGGWPK